MTSSPHLSRTAQIAHQFMRKRHERAQSTASSEDPCGAINGGDHAWRSDCHCEHTTRLRPDVGTCVRLLRAFLGCTCPAGEDDQLEGRGRLRIALRYGRPSKRQQRTNPRGRSRDSGTDGVGRYRAKRPRRQGERSSPFHTRSSFQFHHAAQRHREAARHAIRLLWPKSQRPHR